MALDITTFTILKAQAATTGIPDEVWLLVALVILFGLAFYMGGHTQVLSGLDARAARIKAGLEEAQRLREEAQAALSDIQRKQRDALNDAEQIIAQAKADAARMTEQAMADLDAAFARREAAMKERIAQAEASAAADLRATAVDAAVAASRTLIADGLDEARAGALIDQAIADLPQRLN